MPRFDINLYTLRHQCYLLINYTSFSYFQLGHIYIYILSFFLLLFFEVVHQLKSIFKQFIQINLFWFQISIRMDCIPTLRKHFIILLYFYGGKLNALSVDFGEYNLHAHLPSNFCYMWKMRVQYDDVGFIIINNIFYISNRIGFIRTTQS